MAKQSFKPTPSATSILFNTPDVPSMQQEVDNERSTSAEKNKGGRPVSKPNREKVSLNISTLNLRNLTKGKLEEKIESKSDFLDHILNEYFKNKPYLR